MHSQLVIVLLVGLAVSAYALDLSHANKRSLETEPRLFGLLNDLYAQVIYPPLNHVVTNLALLGAQILAGISQNGIPAPGGRMVHLSEAQLRGFWDDLWNNIVKPPLENALSGVSLLGAQLLAGVATNGVNLGKRDLTEAELRGFWQDFLQNAILGPVENALSGVALLGAQVLAGVATNGVNLGKRDLTEAELRGFWSDFWNNAIKPPLENALSGASLLAAQVLAGVANNGVTLGKRDLTEAEMRGFWQDFLNNAILGPVENALSGVALLGAQLLAGVATNGVTLGKRDLTEAEMRGFLDDFANALTSVFSNVIQKPLEDALAGGALMLAQVLAGAGTNGINLSGLFGKRDLTEAEMRNFWQDFLNNAILGPVNNALSGVALLGAQLLAGVATNGVNLGKRDLTEAEMRGFLDDFANALTSVFSNVIQKPLEDALAGGALMLAQVLAGVATNGVNLGKRDLTEAEMRGFLDDFANALTSVFSNVIQKPLEDALAGGALMLAQVLAGAGTNGINLSGLFGKRDLTEAEMRGFLDDFANALTSVFSNVIQKPLEDALAGGALMLAQVLAGAGTNGINLSSLFGKRDLSELAGRQEELRGFFDTLGNALLDGLQSVWSNVLQNPVEQALQSGALLGAQVLAGLGTNGVNLSTLFGKRDTRGIFDDLVSHANGLLQTQVKPIVENALNNAAIHLAGVLANFAQGGLGRR